MNYRRDPYLGLNGKTCRMKIIENIIFIVHYTAITNSIKPVFIFSMVISQVSLIGKSQFS
jgi:hypothetical protein